MTYEDFLKNSGLVVRKSYYDGAVVPMFRDSGLSEQDFCARFADIVCEMTGARIITISDNVCKVVSDDFLQLHERTGDKCTLIELLNATDDTIGE